MPQIMAHGTRHGTWARAENNLLAALESVQDDDGEQVFVRGRSLFVGFIPPKLKVFPSVAYGTTTPTNFSNVVGRGSGATIFSYEIVVFGPDRPRLIEFVDAVIGALQIARFRASLGTGEADGPGGSKRISLYVETR